MRTSGSGRSLGIPRSGSGRSLGPREIVALSSDLVLPGRRDHKISQDPLLPPVGPARLGAQECSWRLPHRAQSWALCCQPRGRAQERWGFGAVIRMCQDPGLASTHLPSTAQAAPPPQH
ncbi:LIM domain only protein 7 [Platysternon megacephalum]|uniref:LIM domain only protein 7 n=1 Tax=Platysternon megacephalum TaxID=55544 RepID=A0A4D9DY38_9SAUR|nr:LIM domain only protein 7 [Platysternon megacephalum]